MLPLKNIGINWDVIVVGSGIAGLTAALTAADANLRVVVLEKAPLIGGTTAYSEAMIWAPNNDHAKHADVRDSSEAALQYLLAACGPGFDASLGAAYTVRASEALRFLEANTQARYELTTGSIDYYPDLPGATSGARALSPLPFDGRRLGERFNELRAPLATTMIFGGMSIMGPDLKHFYRVGRSLRSTLVAARLLARYAADRLRGFSRGTILTGGNGVLAALLLALDERGVEIFTDAQVTGLRVENGRVAGASVRGSKGEVATLSASRGVVLASGGFGSNTELTSQLYGHVAAGKDHWSLVPEANQGDGIAMARSLGASFRRDLSQPAAWAPVSLVPMGSGAVPVPHFGDRSKPGVIAVNARGRRFTNEAIPYHDFVPAMVATCSAEPKVEVFLLADHTAQRRYGLGAAPPFPGRVKPFIRSGYLVSASTVGELAAQLGIDSKALNDTISTFNAGASEGMDLEFGKGSDAYGRSNGDAMHRPNPCVAPLRTPPYYAVRVVPGDLGTFAGLRTDEYGRVLRDSIAPIPGLYAAGSDMASPMAGAYPAAGVAVGSAITFAYIAARYLAGKA